MFNSQVLEVGIGLILCFLLVSLVLTAVRETVEAWMKTRALDLEKAISELLQDNSKSVEAFYSHPLIYGLYKGSFTPSRDAWSGGNSPTYIPRRQFALAVLDLAENSPDKIDPRMKEALSALGRRVHDDSDALRAELEAWYDAAMDRASGWYRRRTQYWIFGMGLFVALALNVNAVVIAQSLSTNMGQRDLLVAQASRLTAAPPVSADGTPSGTTATAQVPDALTLMKDLQLPIGWSGETFKRIGKGFDGNRGSDFLFGVSLLVGYLVTALAATLGAPFWFDVLNRFMVIRSTVKPSEKSGDEGSEDRAPQRTIALVDSSGPRPRPGQPPVAAE